MILSDRQLQPLTTSNRKKKIKIYNLHKHYVWLSKQTTLLHPERITITLKSPLGPITATNPPRSWWSYKITWMTVRSNICILKHHTSTPHLPTQKT